jgi:hypothetical protein
LGVAEVLLTLILVTRRRPLLPLLVFMSFLVGHESLLGSRERKRCAPSPAVVEPEDRKDEVLQTVGREGQLVRQS